jgi:cellulose biosynthesis protein BcsQ
VQVLSVSSLKGGVGKTTIALGLASAALNKGINTLLIDLDPQSDATSGLGAVSESGFSVAEVLQSPKIQNIKMAIVASHWHKGSKMDVMVGSPRSLLLDNPAPTIADVWKLEEVLTLIEDDYDLVIIDTPPSINALTRTAWVASDRVLIVTEPSLYSVIAADRARKAINEISAKLTPRLQLLGVVVNRYRSQSNEHEYRIKELREMFSEQLLMPFFEERAAIQQSTGAARPIHSWPAEGAREVAQSFDWLLAGALSNMTQGIQRRERVGVVGRATRGQASPIAELITGEIEIGPLSRKAARKKSLFRR